MSLIPQDNLLGVLGINQDARKAVSVNPQIQLVGVSVIVNRGNVSFADSSVGKVIRVPIGEIRSRSAARVEQEGQLAQVELYLIAVRFIPDYSLRHFD